MAHGRTPPLAATSLTMLVLPQTGFAATIEEDEGVLVLDDENFDDALTQYNPLLVEFYAPVSAHVGCRAPRRRR